MSNIKNFVEQGQESPIIYNIYGRMSGSGKPTYMVQLMQPMKRTANVSDRTSMLLAATQGQLPNRKLTHIINVSEDRINNLLNAAGLDEVTDQMKKDLRENGERILIFSAVASDKVIEINDISFFAVDVAVELTESPVKNPNTPNQEVVINPVTGQVVTHTTANGESVEYYAHTDIAPASVVSHQFINEYFTNADARQLPITVMEQLAKADAANVSVAAGEVEVTQ